MRSIERVRWAAMAGFGVIVLAVGMMGAGLAGAEEEDGEGRGPCCRGGRGAALAEELGLDEEQQAMLEEAQEYKRERRSMRRAQRGAGMFAGLADGEMDADSIHADIDERFEEARTQAHAAADARIAFWDSLDDTQRQQLTEHLEQQGSRGQRMRGPCAEDGCRRGHADRCRQRGRCNHGERNEAAAE